VCLPVRTGALTEELGSMDLEDRLHAAVARQRELLGQSAGRPTAVAIRTPEEMAVAGDQALKTLLTGALRQTEHYGSLRAELSRKQHFSLSDFPILSKTELRESFQDLIRVDQRSHAIPGGRMFLSRTSGSTGQPCVTLRSDAGARADTTIRTRLFQDSGVPDAGDLWNLGLFAIDQPVVQASLDWPVGIRWNLPPVMDDNDEYRRVARYAAQTCPPVALIGNSKLVDHGKFLLDAQLPVPQAPVFWSYETLTAGVRDWLTETFGGPVRTYYGTAETGVCGRECLAGSLHFDPDISVLEVLRPDGTPCDDHEDGRIILTALHSLAMPIIRYDTGDLGRRVTGCRCGQQTPAVSAVTGRTATFLVDPTGATFGTYYIVDVISRLGLRNFQLVQSEPSFVELRYADERLPEQFEQRLAAALEFYGSTLNFRLVPGAQSPTTEAGKRNIVVQLASSTSTMASHRAGGSPGTDSAELR